ncbi:MAG TPA: FxSxx-COOH system tetratricopeptide repeat protein [Ktedonobacteraceae bacterium]
MSRSQESAKSLFYSYAHEDEQLCKELEKHLKLLERQGLICGWHDRMIAAGIEAEKEIDDHLQTADIILLLISASFLASDYCYSREMQRALDRHRRGHARVIPLILRPVDWTDAPFSHLQVLPTGGMPVDGPAWRNHDEAFANISEGIRRVIKELNSQPPQHVQRRWNIPYLRNAFFIGRESILQQVRTGFLNGRALMLPQALCGLGGIGKTQIAIEYAYRYDEAYSGVLWARASTRDMLILDFVAIANILDLEEKNDQDQMHIIAAVKQWLANNKGWLLILDNIHEIDLINEFLPTEVNNHVLLTTQAQAVGTSIRKIQVEEMGIEEGERFLLRRASVSASGHGAAGIPAGERESARTLVALSGGLPLALDQAGAYVEETGCSIFTYVSRYRDHQASLLQRRGRFGKDHPEPVTTTLSLSFDLVEQENAMAVELLKFCAFLSPDAIPEKLIFLGASELGPNLQSIIHDPLLLDEAVGVLRRYSLVKRNSDINILSIHPLLQTTLKARMDQREQCLWAERAVIVVSRAFPDVFYETWDLCQQYLPHAIICSQLLAEYELFLGEAVQLLKRTGFYLYDHALYPEAEALFVQSLAISEKVWGSEHLETADCLNKLAELYYTQFKLEKAEALWKRALAIRERLAGGEHPATAEILDNLAVLYSALASYIQAEAFFTRALAILEKHLGPEHKDTGQTLNNLAVLYHKQKRFGEAETLHRRALAISEKVFGSQHPLTAHSLDCLGRLYHDQGVFDAVETLYQQALAIREKELGSDHLRTAGSLGNLAEFYCDQGHHEQATLLSQRALGIMEKMLGPEHPNTAVYRCLVAKVYGAQGFFEPAEMLYRQALASMEKVLGAQHPVTIKCLHRFALFCEKQGRDEQADALYRRVFSHLDTSLPSSYPDIISLLKDYAMFLRKSGETASIEEVEKHTRYLEDVLD